MIKVDKKTGKQVTLSNATFSLYKLNETINEWEKVSCKVGKKSYDTWTTDENATAYTETKLDAGTYKVDEIQSPTGYLELEEDCIFNINRSNDTLEYDKELLKLFKIPQKMLPKVQPSSSFFGFPKKDTSISYIFLISGATIKIVF